MGDEFDLCECYSYDAFSRGSELLSHQVRLPHNISLDVEWVGMLMIPGGG